MAFAGGIHERTKSQPWASTACWRLQHAQQEALEPPMLPSCFMQTCTGWRGTQCLGPRRPFSLIDERRGLLPTWFFLYSFALVLSQCWVSFNQWVSCCPCLTWTRICSVCSNLSEYDRVGKKFPRLFKIKTAWRCWTVIRRNCLWSSKHAYHHWVAVHAIEPCRLTLFLKAFSIDHNLISHACALMWCLKGNEQMSMWSLHTPESRKCVWRTGLHSGMLG